MSEILYDAKAEQAVLGSLMLDPDLTPMIADKVSATDFGVARCAELYQVLLSLFDQSMPYDTWLILDEAKKQGLDIEPSFIIDCQTATNSAYYVEHYAGIVKRWSEKRKQLAIATEYAQRIHSGEDPAITAAWLSAAMAGAVTKDNAQMSLAESLVVQDELIEKWESPENGEELERWSWAWGKWNNLIMPPPKGIMTLVSAAESTGKSIIGEIQAEDWARKGNNIVYFHFELNKQVMITRRLSRLSGISYRKLVTNSLTPQERKLRDDVKAYIQQWSGNIEYVYCAGWDVDRVIAKMRVLQLQGLCDAFILDYFNKLAMSDRQSRRRMGQEEYTRDNVEQLAIFTNDENAGARGVILAQLRKSGKDKSFEALGGTDLMGTAALSEKVNVSIIARREQLTGGKIGAQGRVIVEPMGMDNKADMKVVKNTLGALGSFEQYSNGCFNWMDEED